MAEIFVYMTNLDSPRRYNKRMLKNVVLLLFSNNSVLLRQLSFALVFGLTSSGLWAAEDGVLGISSTGQLTVRLDMTEGVEIRNLNDIELTTTRDNISGNLTLTEDFCVRGNIGAQFQVLAETDSQQASNFSLVGSQGDRLNYRIRFSDSLSEGGTFEELRPNRLSRIYTINEYTNCTSINNVGVELIFEEEDILTSVSIEYTGVLFITVQLV